MTGGGHFFRLEGEFLMPAALFFLSFFLLAEDATLESLIILDNKLFS